MKSTMGREWDRAASRKEKSVKKGQKLADWIGDVWADPVSTARQIVESYTEWINESIEACEAFKKIDPICGQQGVGTSVQSEPLWESLLIIRAEDQAEQFILGLEYLDHWQPRQKWEEAKRQFHESCRFK